MEINLEHRAGISICPGHSLVLFFVRYIESAPPTVRRAARVLDARERRVVRHVVRSRVVSVSPLSLNVEISSSIYKDMLTPRDTLRLWSVRWLASTVYIPPGYRLATHAASHHTTRPPTTNLAETHVGTVGEDPGPVRPGCAYTHTARARGVAIERASS